jgi:hypothetical protein
MLPVGCHFLAVGCKPSPGGRSLAKKHQDTGGATREGALGGVGMERLATHLTWVNLLAWLAVTSPLAAEEPPRRPVEGIMDNSFLIEEAYNQEAGVVQHIFNGVYGVDKVFGPVQHALDLSFTQEWPVFTQTHQFSYTVPYSFTWDGSRSARGPGDVLLNYRYQAYLNERTLAARPRRGRQPPPRGFVCNLPRRALRL